MRSVTLFFLIVAACGHGGWPQGNYDKYPAPPKEVVLGVGDIVDVNVWEQKDLSTEATVRPDGTITMPLVGDLQAKGKTPSQLRDETEVLRFHQPAHQSLIHRRDRVVLPTWRVIRYARCASHGGPMPAGSSHGHESFVSP